MNAIDVLKYGYQTVRNMTWRILSSMGSTAINASIALRSPCFAID